MCAQPLLDLRHLQMIREIAARERVSDAAAALGLTPSALSHRIREAERRLGVTLFVRLNKRLRMTPAAEHLAAVAERLLDELDRTERDVRRMDSGVAHVVRIAVEAYNAYFWLPDFIRALSDVAPGIELHVAAAAGRDPLQSLSRREVDVVIRSGLPESLEVVSTALFDDELRFITPPDHRLAGREAIEGPDIVGETFFTFARTPSPDREFARLFRPSESYPRWAATVELPEAIVELVAAGRGISVLSAWAIRAHVDAGRVASARVGRDGVSVPWVAAIRAKDSEAQGAPARRVAQALADWCRARGGFGSASV